MVKNLDDMLQGIDDDILSPTLQGGVGVSVPQTPFPEYHRRFPNRSSYNPAYNLLQQGGEITGGLEYLWNQARGGNPSGGGIVGDIPNVLSNVLKGTVNEVVNPQIVKNIIPSMIEGTLQNWGQSEMADVIRANAQSPNGYAGAMVQAAPKFNLAAAGQSLMANPLNFGDILGLGRVTGLVKGLEGAKAMAMVPQTLEDMQLAKILEGMNVARGTGKRVKGLSVDDKTLREMPFTSTTLASGVPEGYKGQFRLKSGGGKKFNQMQLKFKDYKGMTSPGQLSIDKLLKDLIPPPNQNISIKNTSYAIPEGQLPLFNPKMKAVPYTKQGEKFSQFGKYGKMVDKALGSVYDFPEKAGKNTRAMSGPIEKVATKIASLAKKTFLSMPSWVATNRIGNNLMRMADENPLEFLTSSFDNLPLLGNKKIKKLIPDDIAKGLFNETGIQPDLLSKFPNPMFAIEQPLESFDRGSHFITQLKRMAKETNLTLEEIVSTPELKRELLARVTKVMGDYISPTILKDKINTIDLFYKWQRAITKATANMMIEHPIKSAMLKGTGAYHSTMANRQEEQLNELGFNVPEHLKYGRVIGNDSRGKPELYTEARAFPLSTIKELTDVVRNPLNPANQSQILSNPLFGLGKIVYGQNWYGRPASSPNIVTNFRGQRFYRNPNGQIEQLYGDALPPKETQDYLLSELIRNFGGPVPGLNRMRNQIKGTTPYDTREWQTNPNVTKHQKALIEAIFGVGSYGSVSKKPKFDESKIQEIFGRADKGDLYKPRPKTKRKKKERLGL